jgi:hypothetical protein
MSNLGEPPVVVEAATRRRVSVIWVSPLVAASIVLSAVLLSGAAAAPRNGPSQEATTPPEIHRLLTLLADPKSHELLALLADPKVQEWLKEEGEAKAAAGSALETPSWITP